VTPAEKDPPHVSPDWEIAADRIDGVVTRDVRNIVTANGITTEVFRQDWGVVGADVVHMIFVTLRAGALSAWHMHKRKTDHLFVVGGHLRAVLYDGREDSPTYEMVNVLHLSRLRPTLAIVPPGVWHGLQTLGSEPGSFVNFFDRQYDYDDPDDWRLPPDTDEIPYRFE
jgi:dTDP-4-dehydrorhamnose 3,5-epimerase